MLEATFSAQPHDHVRLTGCSNRACGADQSASFRLAFGAHGRSCVPTRTFRSRLRRPGRCDLSSMRSASVAAARSPCGRDEPVPNAGSPARLDACFQPVRSEVCGSARRPPPHSSRSSASKALVMSRIARFKRLSPRSLGGLAATISAAAASRAGQATDRFPPCPPAISAARACHDAPEGRSGLRGLDEPWPRARAFGSCQARFADFQFEQVRPERVDCRGSSA